MSEAADRIKAFAKEHKLSVIAAFVPFSQSRNKANKHKSVNWKITLFKTLQADDAAKVLTPEQAKDIGGPPILECDYSAGTGHCPGDKRKDSYRKQELINWECENGFAGFVMESLGGITRKQKSPILPDLCDILSSLSLDSSVIDEGPFEEWAKSMGYDTDSRNAEKIYNACLDTAVRLRRGIGDAAMTALREACQDY